MPNNSLTTPHRGFTLIELAFVIVILSIIAVAALPRFIDLNNEAHRASVAGTAASFQEAVILSRAAAIAQGLTKRTNQDNLPNFGNNDVDINFNGYPVDTAGGGNPNSIGTGATGNTRCLNVWRGILQNPPTVTTSVAATAPEDWRAARTAAETCTYTYRKDRRTPARNFTYNATTGVITVVLNP